MLWATVGIKGLTHWVTVLSFS